MEPTTYTMPSTHPIHFALVLQIGFLPFAPLAWDHSLPTTASHVAGIADAHHHVRVCFLYTFFVHPSELVEAEHQ